MSQAGPGAIFIWGLVGSVAVDVMALAKFYEVPVIEFPERYRRISYYIVRLVVALIAGGLAVAYGIDKEILAINIGAATPLIIQAFSNGLPTPNVQPILPTTGKGNNKARISNAKKPAQEIAQG